MTPTTAPLRLIVDVRVQSGADLPTPPEWPLVTVTLPLDAFDPEEHTTDAALRAEAAAAWKQWVAAAGRELDKPTVSLEVVDQLVGAIILNGMLAYIAHQSKG